MVKLIKEVDHTEREQAIDLLNQFFKLVNSFKLDGVFQVKKNGATKMIDLYLKLKDNGKILFLGYFLNNQLIAMVLCKVEDRPFLYEEKILYIDIAITRQGHRNQGYMKELLSSTEEWARKKNIKIIELRALTENKDAIRYWNSQDFKEFYIRFRKSI
jgi:GNAT superfamily N-acetyltransferase